LAVIADDIGMNGGKFDFLRVRRRFRQPITTGHGTVESVDRILIRTEVDGTIGYGEAAPWPGFLTETCDQIAEVLRSARGSLSHLSASVSASQATLPCLSSALSSCAHWDEIESFTGSLACAGLLTEASAAQLAEKYDQGYRTVKIKLHAGSSLEEISQLLLGAPADLRLRLDANGAFGLEQARSWIQWVRQQPSVEFIEQPLAAGQPGYASLGTEKVALDESFLTPAGVEWLGPVVIKPCLAGDWDELLRWRQQRTSPVVYSSCFETAIGRQAALWLAAQDPAVSTVGFDTLGRFEMDGRDRHEAGPIARGLLNVSWHALWTEMS
jgi:O-succinylbenzoate synthase